MSYNRNDTLASTSNLSDSARSQVGYKGPVAQLDRASAF